MKREIDTEILSKIAVCLVEPTYAGNVGSVARAMKNMGLSRLIRVGGVDPDTHEARQFASGNYDIVENSLYFETLREAIEPFSLVVGTSRRTGKSRRPTHTSRDFPGVLFPLLRDGNEAVILFGREKHGLFTEELDLCQMRVMIPSHDQHGSLNLAQAVLIVCHEIYMAAGGEYEFPERKLATSKELESMYDHFRESLLEIGFCDPANPDWMIRALRNIFSRSRLDSRDIRILRGILSDFSWYIDHCVETGKRDGKERIEIAEK